MALKVEVGFLTSPSATGNQTISLNDASFGTVKALILIGSYHTTEGDTDGNAIFCQGFGTYRGSVVQQVCDVAFSADAGPISDTARGDRNSSILRGYSAAVPTVDFDAALVSLGNAQFVLNWTDLPGTASLRFMYIALGGPDLTDALVKDMTIPASTTGVLNETVATGIGQPNLIIASYSSNNPNADSATDIELVFGAGIDNVNEGSTSIADDDNNTTMTMAMGQKSSLVFNAKAIGTNTELELSARSSWPTDGFQINRVVVPGFVTTLSYLALFGTFKSVVSEATVPTGATLTQDLPVGSTPRGAIFFHNVLASQAGVNTTDSDLGTYGIGAMDGTREGHVAFGNNDNEDDTQTHRHHSESKAVRMITPSASGTIASQADSSFNGNNVRLTWLAADTVAREYRYLLFGDAELPPQLARPITDITDGLWTNEAGSNVNLYASIDETSASDTDYIQSSSSPASADIAEVGLTSLSDPVSSTGHKVRYRYKKDATGGDQINLTVRLMQGTTEIASWSHTNIDAITSAEQTLSTGQADSITDYTNLRLRFEAVKP